MKSELLAFLTVFILTIIEIYVAGGRSWIDYYERVVWISIAGKPHNNGFMLRSESDKVANYPQYISRTCHRWPINQTCTLMRNFQLPADNTALVSQNFAKTETVHKRT